MNNAKPRRVIAKLTRRVTEIADVTLDKDGNIEEYNGLVEELDYDDSEVFEIRSVLSVHD